MFGKCKVCGYKDKRIKTFDALNGSKGIRIINVDFNNRIDYLNRTGINSLEEKKMALVAAPFDYISRDNPNKSRSVYIRYIDGVDKDNPDFYIDSYPQIKYHQLLSFDMNYERWLIFGEGKNDDKGYYQVYLTMLSDTGNELFQPQHEEEIEEAINAIDAVLRGKA